MIHPRVQTTNRESADRVERSEWLDFLPSRRCDDHAATYVFTDGSSKGSYAAVFVCPTHPEKALEEHVAWKPPTATGNMGAEWKGLLLALQHAPKGAKLVVVSDLLWLGAWMVDRRKAEHPETVESLRKAKEFVEQRRLDVRFVHHSGHQKDDSDFTRWNNRVDELCKTKAKEQHGTPDPRR